jgi:tetratricopeptide (TPR) repeat protein
MKDLSPALAAELRDVTQIARRGDLRSALARAEDMLARSNGSGVIHAFAGMLHCQAGNLLAGIPHLRAALAGYPDDITTATNLANALAECGQTEEAVSVCTEARAARDPSFRLWRLRGGLLQAREDYAGAVKAYEQVVIATPDDFESWNNLGNARSAVGDVAGSVKALQKATALRPDVAPIRLNLATALLDSADIEAATGVLQNCVRDFPNDPKPLVELAALMRSQNRHEESLAALERAVVLSPGDADLRIRLGEELVILWSLDRAEIAFRAALAIDPAQAEGHVQLAALLDYSNRPDELGPLIASAEALGVEAGSVHFIRALSCRREKRFEDGLTELLAVPEHIQPARCAQLRGEFYDRTGQADLAFESFAEVNRLLALDPTEPVERSGAYLTRLREERAAVTAAWYSGWKRADVPEERASPAFLVGFPRSGTTLLDTMLMGHPDVQVLEERPTLRRVQEAIGGFERLPELGPDDIRDLRALYFSEVRNHVDLRAESLLVDKFPLYLNRVPLIHRLFPDARFILALRHPFDVVLSCFMTSFRLNNAMSNFLDLRTAAETYDLTFGFWNQCREMMPIQVHEVKYENMVADSEAELRPLFNYLGLKWNADALDHQRTAAARGTITTASYAQVIEPLYDRAAGRWERYRRHMEPVLPILQPWAEQMGYAG